MLRHRSFVVSSIRRKIASGFVARGPFHSLLADGSALPGGGSERIIEDVIRAEVAADEPLHSGLKNPWLGKVDRAIGAVAEPVAAALVVAEVVILASGVFSRWVLRSSLVWTDELATILFLWLAMIGAVIALRRGEHMRLTALVRIAGRAKPWFDAASSVVVALFCLEMLPASQKLFAAEIGTATPALGISSSWLVLSIFVGMALLFVASLLRLADSDRRIVLTVVACTAALALAAWLARPLLMQLGNVNLVLFFVVLVLIFVAIGVPIAFAFGTATLSYLFLTTTVPLTVVVSRIEDGISNLTLLAVPLFVLLGLLMGMTGIARHLVQALAAAVGRIRGGLGIVLIFAMYLVSGISGSKTADMAAVAPVLFPEMRRRGIERPELISLLNASASMSETIPPSLVLIIVGSVMSVSIAALFTAGLLPAAVAAAILLIVTVWRARRDNTELAERPGWRRVLRYFAVALPGFALPLVIRGFVLGGIATATEVSTVGIIYSVLVGLFVYREFDLKRVYPILRESASLTGAIMLIIAGATTMAWALTQSGFAQQLAAVLGKLPGGAPTFLAVSCLLFIVLGSVLEGIPAIVLFGPLLFPIAAALHINEVHYAICAILAMGIGLHSPPLGVGYYAACIIGKAPPDEAMLRVLPYMSAIVLALILVAAFPWLSLGFLKH